MSMLAPCARGGVASWHPHGIHGIVAAI